MISKTIFILLSLFIAQVAVAIVPVDSMVAECTPYPEIKDISLMPIKFNPTNNLTKPDVSGFYQAEGEKITIYGRVMDSECVPLSDAKIYIWQLNKAGYVQYETKDAPKAQWIDPNFNGTGITNSDNLGRFNFTTIKPGSSYHYTPHVTIMVEHPKLKTLYSKIYFPAHVGAKIKDKHVINTTKAAQVSAIKSPDKNNVYFIDITIPQDLPYKEY